jgi:hypothetical protein
MTYGDVLHFTDIGMDGTVTDILFNTSGEPIAVTFLMDDQTFMTVELTDLQCQRHTLH